MDRATYLRKLSLKKGEQYYQSLLESNTELIPREFVLNHGVHFSLVLRKLSMAKDYTTDFFYLSKSTVKWNCVLIEIEKPSSRFFTKGKNSFHKDFMKGLDQIDRWRALFSLPSNFQHFVDSTISTIRNPLKQNPCRVKYVLVFGRRSEYENSDLQRRLVLAKESEDFRIITYDSLIEDIENRHRLYLGIRHNESMRILSKDVIDESIFRWCEPSELCVATELKAHLIKEIRSRIRKSSAMSKKLGFDQKLLEKIQTLKAVQK